MQKVKHTVREKGQVLNRERGKEKRKSERQSDRLDSKCASLFLSFLPDSLSS